MPATEMAARVAQAIPHLPELTFWRSPTWRCEELDYGNRVKLCLVAKHPTTGDIVDLDSRELIRRENPEPAMRAMIETANAREQR